jgi:hypothetical protein
MNDNPIDQTKIHSAKALARLRELSAKQEELAKQQKALVEQEQEVTKNRIELLKSEEIVEVAEKALNEHYTKVKSQQYRWEKRLTEINKLTEELVHSLDMLMPSSMIPRMKSWDELREYKGQDHHRFTQVKPARFLLEDEKNAPLGKETSEASIVSLSCKKIFFTVNYYHIYQ